MLEFEQILKNSPVLENALISVHLNAKEKLDLGVLYLCADGVALTRDKGSRARGETVHSSSKVGSRLKDHFGGVGPRDKMMWVGEIQADTDGGEKWVMRPEMKLAIKNLGWF